jgi:hypothetical protein
METKNKINLITMHLSELMPSDYNPRKITCLAKRGLRESIKTFGYVDPIIWNKRTGKIVSGHQRYAALVEIHGKDHKMEINVIDVDEQTEKAMNIAMNNPEIQGTFDSESLNKLLENIMAFPKFIDLNFDLIKVPMEKEPKLGINRKDPILYPNWIVIRYDEFQIDRKIIRNIKNEIEKTGAKIICSEKII